MNAHDSDGYSGTQQRDYKKESNDMAGSKEISSKTMDMIKGGTKVTHDGRGSSQSYAKGSKVNMSINWNPQKGSASTYGIKGV